LELERRARQAGLLGEDQHRLSVNRILLLLALDKVTEDRFLAQCLARLKPMQTLHEDETLAIAPDQDWGRLPDLNHTFRNLSHSVRLKRRAALHRHIDFRDR
jgi:hypothetical protein